MKYWVIEHSTLGWFLSLTRKGEQWVPKFAWSIMASDKKPIPIQTRRATFYFEYDAQRIMKNIPESVRLKCKIKEIKK